MKISSFYLNDISEYDNFIDKFVQDIDMKFYGKGCSSINMSGIISFIRQELTKYIKIKYNKHINVIIMLPRSESRLIEKEMHNKKEQIRLYLDYYTIKSILIGDAKDYPDYINTILDQLDTYVLSEKTQEFNSYLIVQMDNLVEICHDELLASFPIDFLKENLKNTKVWGKFIHQSSIFNDYYKFYNENKEENKKYFLHFLFLLNNMIM